MNFEEFKDTFATDVKDTLERRSGEAYEVETRKVDKMNESYEALTVKQQDQIIGVNLNLDSLYKELDDGADYGVLVSKAADIASDALQNTPQFDITEFKDYDTMKDTLAIEVVSAERNKELLETVPHREIEDMAVVYRFVLGGTDNGVGSILVTNQMLDNYGISADKLHEDALKNAPEIRPLVIEGMAEVLAKQMGVDDLDLLGLNIPPEQEQMFVASVEGNVHGAGVLAYQNFMDQAAERARGSFFILPSSIHEVLIIPDNGCFDTKSLENMVKEVNATTVDIKDQLTDHVYHYDAEAKVFELAEKFEERVAAKYKDISKDAETKELPKPHKDRGGEAI
ncbi:DUF5688 family protein [Butyrivibrio sp. INlla16]|uniref:DUF5688 family protein n=1 Tax=Butyrivibrio sp. INlla16 TaxID=1520807 RepID=UPI000884427A|nr:DUF5688 family protein [Butyrivibrio sp. INlla16]SDB12941.1 hypothetical protein SAMN02910263_00586 [Butyrivibrio sp. INlla16]